MTVVTPRSEGATLPAPGKIVELGAVTIANAGEPCAVLVSSLAEQPLNAAGRLLMIVPTHALNTGLTFTDASTTTLVSLGRLPMLMRTAKITVTLRNENAGRLKLWALAPNGARVEAIPVEVAGDRVTAIIDTGALAHGPTPYFEWAMR